MKRVGGMSRSLRSFNRQSAAFARPMILVEEMCQTPSESKNRHEVTYSDR
jgi:hypothetical protein